MTEPKNASKATSAPQDKHLLNFVKDEEFKHCLGSRHYQHLKDNCTKGLRRWNTLRDSKMKLIANGYYNELLAHVRASPLGNKVQQKRLQPRDRAQYIDNAQCVTVKQAITQARNRFLGYLATNIPSEMFDELLGCFGDVKYDNIKITPQIQKHTVYENETDQKVKDYFEPSIKNINLSNNLPPGFKAHTREHPQELMQRNREVQSQSSQVHSSINEI